MKGKRFSEEQIIKVLQAVENVLSVQDACRQYGIATATYYVWRRKFGGMEISEAKRLKELERENNRLKKLVADLSLDNQMLKEINSKKW